MISSESYPINSEAFYRMTPINLFHYPFCPPDRIGDDTHSGKNPRTTVVNCASLRVARIDAAISSTRLRPSSSSYL
jgi:hypothetical protein